MIKKIKLFCTLFKIVFLTKPTPINKNDKPLYASDICGYNGSLFSDTNHTSYTRKDDRPWYASDSVDYVPYPQKGWANYSIK